MRPVAPTALVIILVAIACAGTPPNTRCEWPEPTASQLSLLDQVRLAEDLAVRFADARREPSQWRANREGCEADLFERIAEVNRISVAAVADGRQALAHRPFDWLVNLPMAALAVVLGWRLEHWASRRFVAGEELAQWLAVAAAAAGIAVAIVGLGQVWAAAIEALRIGNGHLSYRALRIPWRHHRLLTLGLAASAVLVISAIGRVARRRIVRETTAADQP